MKIFFKKYLVIAVLLLIVAIGLLGYGQNMVSLTNVFAAVFDTSLLPSIDNTWNLGLKQNATWQKGRFSRTVGIGFGADREADVDLNSDALILGPTATSTGEGGQLKLLGTFTNNYYIIDNYGNDLRILMRGGAGKELERVRIAESVGGVAGPGILIGTSSTMAPGESLEVIGNIVSKGTEWTSRTSADNTWQSVAYGNGRFVAVSGSSTPSSCNGIISNCVMTSENGVNWATSTTPASNNWNSITYGNGLFVAVAVSVASGMGTCTPTSFKCVMTSPDGIIWTLRDTPESNNWNSITYGNGIFVAVASIGTNRIMVSSDGLNWKTASVPFNLWYSVTYGNGLFVAVASFGGANCSGPSNFCIMTSIDGLVWTSRASPVSNNWYSVTYGNGLFVAVATTGQGTCVVSGDNRCVMTSSDGGITNQWVLRSVPSSLDWRSVIYGNGLFVAVGNSGTGNRIMSSPDGINWTARSSVADNNWRAITYGNGVFVVVAFNGTGNRVMTSGKSDFQITPHNNIYQGGMSIMGSATGTLSVGTTSFPGLFTVASASVAFIVSTDGKIRLGNSNPEGALTFRGQMLVVDQNNVSNYSELSSGQNSGLFSTIITSRGAGSSFLPLNFNFDKGIVFMASTSDATGVIMKEAGSVSSTGYWFLGGPEVSRGGSGKAGLRIGPKDVNNFEISAPSFAGAPSNLSITNDGGDIYMDAFRVGIGTTSPTEKLQIFGNLKVGSYPSGGRIQNFDQTQICSVSSKCTSDIRLKKNINPLLGVLDVLTELKPTYYSWRADEFPEFGFYAGARNLGLIAQDVEKVFPNLVGTSTRGYKTVDYTDPALTVYLIEAIKELNEKTDSIGNRIKTLEVN